MNKTPKERVIYDNYNLSKNYSDEDIEDKWREDGLTDEEIEEKTDSDYWDERYIQDEFDWDEASYLLNKYFSETYKLVCEGSVGRWDGVYKGKLYFNTLDELLDKAGEDCDYFKFYDCNGHLYLHCSHHDGTCSFEIKEVTEKGYTRLLRIAEREWGCPAREYEPQTKETIQRQLNNQARSFYC